MKKFYQSRKSQRTVVTVVLGHQVPLYGGISAIPNTREHHEKMAIPMNLTFVVRSRAYILGRLVKSKFYRRVRCSVTLRGNRLGKPHNLTNACVYQWMTYTCVCHLYWVSQVGNSVLNFWPLEDFFFFHLYKFDVVMF